MNDSNISLTKEVVNDIFIRKALPLVALTIICAVVGTFGNVFVLYIHIFKYQRCTFRCFVLGLCAVDLTSSVIIVPLEVYNYMNWFIFPSAGLCGFKAFMNVFLTVSSVYVLLMIAIDRYLKVCAPHRQQLTPVLVLKCYCLCFFLACGQSWPILKIWSQRTIVRLFDLTPVKISMCLAVHGNDIWRKVFTALLIPTYIALFGMLVIYIIVGKRIFGVLENMRRQSTRKKTLRRKHFVDVDHKVDNRKLERASSTSQKESSALESTHESKEKGEHLDNTTDVFSGKVMIYTIKDNNVVLKERKSVDGMSQKDLFLQKRKLEERSSKLLLSRASSAPMSSSHRVSVSNMSSDVSGLKKYASTPVSTVTNSNSETSDSETMSFGQINDSDNGAKTIEDDGTNNQLTVAFSPVLENTVRRKSIFTKRVKFNFSAREKLKRRTLITFIFTAIFIVSSLTNIILQSRMTHLSERTELSSYSEILVDFAFFKLYFINFVIHPILYGILDPRFRKCMRQTSKQFVFRS